MAAPRAFLGRLPRSRCVNAMSIQVSSSTAAPRSHWLFPIYNSPSITSRRGSTLRVRARPRPPLPGGDGSLPATCVFLKSCSDSDPLTPSRSAAAVIVRAMGIWERFKSAFVSDKTVEQVDRAAHPTPAAQSLPQRQPEVHEESTTAYKQSAATARFYEAERERAKAAGQTVKGYRAGYTPTEGQTVKGYRAGYIPAPDAKAQLVAGPEGLPPLKLVTSNNGLDLALPDGKLIDYNTLALRHFQIFAFRVVGMSYYEDPEKPFKFRNGQRVTAKRESDNEHDANAVAITTGRAATKIGYVNKQRAKWVSDLLDKGQELDGIIIQNKSASPRVLLTTPEMLAHLRRP